MTSEELQTYLGPKTENTVYVWVVDFAGNVYGRPVYVPYRYHVKSIDWVKETLKAGRKTRLKSSDTFAFNDVFASKADTDARITEIIHGPQPQPEPEEPVVVPDEPENPEDPNTPDPSPSENPGENPNESEPDSNENTEPSSGEESNSESDSNEESSGEPESESEGE